MGTRLLLPVCGHINHLHPEVKFLGVVGQRPTEHKKLVVRVSGKYHHIRLFARFPPILHIFGQVIPSVKQEYVANAAPACIYNNLFRSF